MTIQELGIKILKVIHHHEHETPVPSGLQWCLRTIQVHMNESQSDVLSALAWLRRKELVTEEKGTVVLTDRGRELVA